MRGITVVAGFIEILLAPVIQKVKSVFPIYVAGLVVTLVGISIIHVISWSYPLGRCGAQYRYFHWCRDAADNGLL